MSVLAFATSVQAQTLEGVVIDILDGDHLLVDFNGQQLIVNLAYIRPPLDGNWDLAATDHLNQLVPAGTLVTFEPAFRLGDIHYGYLSADGVMVNLQMLEAGLVETPWQIPPGKSAAYDYAETQAIAQGNGLYAPPPTPLPNWTGPAIGVGGALLVMGAIRAMKRKHVAKPATPRKVSNKQLQETLTTTLATQKQLERDYAEAQMKADEWFQRAEQAMQQNEEDLAKQALVEKKRFHQKAQDLQKTLEVTQAQVSDLRHQLDQWDALSH